MSGKTRRESLQRRHLRLRNKVSGTPARPRLCVTRTLKHIHAQVIDDETGRTLVSASSSEAALREQLKPATGNSKAAETIGQVLAERARERDIVRVVFDRGGSRYHGRVQKLAEAARKAGLEF